MSSATAICTSLLEVNVKCSEEDPSFLDNIAWTSSLRRQCQEDTVKVIGDSKEPLLPGTAFRILSPAWFDAIFGQLFRSTSECHGNPGRQIGGFVS